MQPLSDVLDALGADGFGHWLAGFIDGEGSFIINRQEQGYRPLMRIKLRDDDAPILYLCQARTGLGRVYPERVYERAENIRNAHPQMVWHVTTKAELPRLVLILERFPLRAKKRGDFDIWKHGVREWTTKPRYGHWLALEALRRQLIANREYQEDDTSEGPPQLYVVQPPLDGMEDMT